MVRGNISDYVGLTIPEMIFGCTILAMLIIGLIVLLRNKLVRFQKNKKGFWILKIVPHVRRREILDMAIAWKHYEGIAADMQAKISLLEGGCNPQIFRKTFF
jgi:hypothetical protein